MKLKTKYFTLLAIMTAWWGTWSYAYHRGFTQGYSQGSTDEFYCWKQEPTRLVFPRNSIVTGRRDMGMALGGKPVPPPVSQAPKSHSVNAIPDTVFP